jgi:hypothetical protein
MTKWIFELPSQPRLLPGFYNVALPVFHRSPKLSGHVYDLYLGPRY